MARKTHLDVSLWTLGGASFLGKFKSASVDIEAINQAGRAVSQRHALAIPVKKSVSINMDELITSSGGSGIRQSNLNVTVWSVGGTSYLGQMRGGSLNVTTDVDEGSGCADEWEYPYACGTSYDISGDLQVASAAVFGPLIAASGITGLLVDVVLQLGGMSFAAPMTLKMGGRGTEEGKTQTEKVTLDARGLPTVGTGNALLASILLGTAQVAYDFNFGGQEYAGNALITKTTVTWADAQLQTASHDFKGQGAPTIS